MTADWRGWLTIEALSVVRWASSSSEEALGPVLLHPLVFIFDLTAEVDDGSRQQCGRGHGELAGIGRKPQTGSPDTLAVSLMVGYKMRNCVTADV